MNLLELIESWNPCSIYKYYLYRGYIDNKTTALKIFNSRKLSVIDKEWFFDRYFAYLSGIPTRYIDVFFHSEKVEVCPHPEKDPIYYSRKEFQHLLCCLARMYYDWQDELEELEE